MSAKRLAGGIAVRGVEGRAFIALANYYRYEGLGDDGATAPLAAITTPPMRERAKLLGALLRVLYLFSASMPGVVPRLSIEKGVDDNEFTFVAPSSFHEFAGERLDGRLQQLAKLTDKKIAFAFR